MYTDFQDRKSISKKHDQVIRKMAALERIVKERTGETYQKFKKLKQVFEGTKIKMDNLQSDKDNLMGKFKSVLEGNSKLSEKAKKLFAKLQNVSRKFQKVCFIKSPLFKDICKLISILKIKHIIY